MENARQMAEYRVEEEKRRAEAAAEYERRRAEEAAEYDRRSAEEDRRRKEAATEAEKRQAEYEKRRAEADERYARQIAEYRAEAEKHRAEADRRAAEAEKRGAELDRRIREVNEAVNGIGKSNGMFAEDFFFTTIENGDRKIFGEQFENCFSLQKRNSKEHRIMGEQDIILLSDESVAFVEVKYRARKDDVQKIIDKLPNLRILYPQHDSRRIYLGIAALSFDKGVEETCNNNGIAIVKQVGDTVVINDEYLKTF